MTGTNQRPTRRSTFGWNPSIGILVRALRFTRPPNLSLRRYLGIYSYLSTRRPAPNKVRFMQNISIFTHSAFSCSRSPARGRWPPGCASGAFPPRISMGRAAGEARQSGGAGAQQGGVAVHSSRGCRTPEMTAPGASRPSHVLAAPTSGLIPPCCSTACPNFELSESR